MRRHNVWVLLACVLSVGCGSSDDSGLVAGGGGVASNPDASVGSGGGTSGGGGSGGGDGGASSNTGGNAPGGGGNTGAGGNTGGSGNASGTGGSPPLDGAAGGINTPDGGLPIGEGGVPSGPTPGALACAGVLCEIAGVPPNVCCAAPPFPFPTQCLPSFPGCGVTGGVPVACDDITDCPTGQVCCGTAPSGAPAGCVDFCDPNGNLQLCRADAECVTGTCQIIASLPEYQACQ